MSIRNPFRVGTEIRKPEDFVGRKDILRVIFEAMPNLQNISLRGERRTGKTSLLLYLASLTSTSDAGLPLAHIPVYFNFQRYAEAKAIRVWQAIIDAVSDNIRKRLPEGQVESERFLSSFKNLPEEPGLYVTVLVRYLARLGSSGFNILFLFDEFDKTKDNSDLGESFYDTLRSLPTETGNISYIIATRIGLAELQSSYDKISSPFFNIFTSLTLSPFSGNEVQYLIFKYCERAEIDFSLAEKLADESSLLYDKTGYHPYFLQSLCYHLYMKSDMPDWPLGQAQKEALLAFEKDLEPHFEYYWKYSSLKEQELIKKLATSQEINWNDPETKALAGILKDRCLVVKTSDSEDLWRLSSSFFGEWVKNKVSRQELLIDNSISDAFLKDLNFIRKTLSDSFGKLEKSPSFTTIINSSASSKQNYEVLTRILDKLKTPFENKFFSAIIGSSKNGKTTVMDEMFPDLSKRGWLVTAVNDTTSQALRIEYAQPSSERLNEVVVHSWNIDQIKGLFNSDYVERENQKDNIKVFYKDDSIEVDGNEATFSKEDLKEFKFSLKQTAKPFPFPFKVPEDKLSDESFIEALTIKQPRNRLQTDNLLTVGNNSYNSLQLRAVVKDVSLKDRFDEIKKWTGLSDNEISSLVFIDTPGLATDGSVKDEVLRHPLAVKSNQIVLELLKNDELDIIIHLVLCAEQSRFTRLWEALENECGAIGMEDLSERLVLAINGTNIYFHDKNMKKEVASGEHFEMSIEDNILLKMSPRGRIQPAKICFLDSRKYIEGSGGPFSKPKYEKIYQNNREIMSEWLTPNTKPYSYLEQMGMVDLFKKNIEALCDPDDRGQGFLIRQIVNLIREKGPVLLLKKYLIRTNLLSTCEKLNKILSTYYDNNGKLNCQATKDAMQNCFSFLDKDDLFSIENFCAENIDPEIEGIMKSDESDENWIRKSFVNICNILLRKIIDESGANRETAAIFKNIFKIQLEKWVEDWGYSSSHMKPNDRTFKLLMHSLKTHAREILYQFLTSSSLFGNLDSFTQTPEDRKEVENIIKELKRTVQKGNQLCIQYGVAK